VPFCSIEEWQISVHASSKCLCHAHSKLTKSLQCDYTVWCERMPLAYFILSLLLQDVRLIQFSAPEVQYSPGDVLMVCPQNSLENVDQLFGLLSVGFDRRLCPDTVIQVTERDSDASVPLALRHPLTLRRCAEQYWDLNVSLRNGISFTVKLGLAL